MNLTELFTADLLTAEAFAVFIQIIFIDLVLAGDNAIIVGMVAAKVPEHMRRRVILFGVGAAVVMRIGFSLVAIQLLSITGLKLVGGLLLLWVCWKLWTEMGVVEGNVSHAASAQGGDQFAALRPAVIQIVIADLSMSIDNVLAIASVSRDYPLLLIFGLALSVAFMIFAATLIARLLKRYPWIAYLGVLLILYVGLVMVWEGILDLGGVMGAT